MTSTENGFSEMCMSEVLYPGELADPAGGQGSRMAWNDGRR
jgi:hypothetical protein